MRWEFKPPTRLNIEPKSEESIISDVPRVPVKSNIGSLRVVSTQTSSVSPFPMHPKSPS